MAYPNSLTPADVYNYAASCGLDPDVAVEQIRHEGRDFNCFAVGSSGEHGIAQFMPGTWAQYGAGDFATDAFDCYESLAAYCAYMQWLLGQTGGYYYDALRMYNGGYSDSTASNNYAAAILQAAGKDIAYTVPPGSQPVGGGSPGGGGFLAGLTGSPALILILIGGVILIAGSK